MNVLIIEDDVFLARKIGQIFTSRVISNRVKIVHSFLEFLEELHGIASYDIVLTDLRLQGGHIDPCGYKIIRIVREKNALIPIVVVSGMSDIDTLRYAFECGASDYIIKPIRLRELEIRVLNWFKNYYFSHIGFHGKVHTYHELSYDIDRNEFTFRWEEIIMTKNNKYLLSLFFAHPEKLLTELFLSEKIWGDDCLLEHRNIRVNILRLKQALAPLWLDEWIENIRWEGYIFSGRSH